MSRSASVSVPRRELYVVPERRGSLELEDVVVPPARDRDQPREYDSWPCDSFFLLPDSVLTCDATAFRQDLMSLDPVLSASLPDWDLPSLAPRDSPINAGRHTRIQSPGGHDSPYRTRSVSTSRVPANQRHDRRGITLLDHHEGLTVHSAGKGTVMIGGGGDGRGGESSGGAGGGSPAANSNSPQQQQQQQQHQQSPSGRRNSSQKDAYWFAHGGNPTNSTSTKQQHTPSTLGGGPNELFFGQDDRSSGLSYKEREDRARQMRDRQEQEKQTKLQELKDQAAAAQRFREQQETERRRRLEDMRHRDADRRTQVEERKRIIQQAEQDRREAVIRKNMVGQDSFQVERDTRLDAKRRNERSNIVFAFGSSTPRMLDPRDSATSFWGTRRATSTTNVHLADTSSASHRRSSDVVDTDLSRKRATSAHSLDRKTEGEDIMSKSMTAAIPSAARRRTDLIPTLPSSREIFGSNKNSPRHRSPGMRSGTVTPNSPSRPASAMSGASGVSSQVSLRPRTSPRKPRPLSIAGSTLTSADKPKDFSRESRPTERKSSVGSLTHKPTRAKSAGSDRSGPTTPARTPATTPSKRPTPQPKTESVSRKTSDSASRKVSLGSKTTTPKSKTTPRTTPLQSPAVESKPLPGTKDKKTSVVKEQKSDSVKSDKVSEENTKSNSEVSVEAEAKKDVEDIMEAAGNKTESKDFNPQTHNHEESEEKTQQNGIIDSTNQSTEDLPKTEETVNNKEEKVEEKVEEKSEENEKSLAQKAAEKPVTGYASEEDYRAALAEKRRLVREEKERQAELERQKIREEEERERREEEEYLRLMDEQRKAEEERLQKAIEAAQKEREEEAKRKEEEEKQRIEAEKIEAQKQLENEERLRKEEEERQARKSRVAAIMARTRGKGGGSTPNKNESKTPSEEGKTFEDGGVMSQSMTDSMIGSLTGSMTGSMIAEATNNEQNENSSLPTSDISSQPTSGISSQPPSDVSSHPSDLSSQPLSDVSSQPELNNKIEDILGGVASIKVSDKLQQPHLNGESPVMPMDTSTPTQQVDLLGNLSHVNSVNHNGVDNTSSNNTQNVQSNNVVDVPLSSTSDAENFEQIIDISQTKLSNEDAVNSNPTTPFIAFEQNLNKKQSQDNTSTVPDLLM